MKRNPVIQGESDLLLERRSDSSLVRDSQEYEKRDDFMPSSVGIERNKIWTCNLVLLDVHLNNDLPGKHTPWDIL